MTDDGGGVVIKAEAARRLGFVRSYITKEARPGGKLAEAVMADGRIDLAVAERLLAERRDTSKGSASNVVLVTDEDRRLKLAKVRKAEADADAAEAARMERLEKLVDREAYDSHQFTRLRMLRDLLMAVPADVADELAAKTDPREIRALLTGKIRAVLEQQISETKVAE